MTFLQLSVMTDPQSDQAMKEIDIEMKMQKEVRER
jgi:hypothetical protein